MKGTFCAHPGPCCESCLQDQQVGMWDWENGCCCEAIRHDDKERNQ